MTQDEVDMIYEYLHENYEYKDGELIVKLDRKNKYLKCGSILGSMNFTNTDRAFIISSATINKKKYRLRLSKFIYIFHKKTCPYIISHIDGNEMNNKIDNLIEDTHSSIQHHYSKIKGCNFYKVLNKNGTYGFSVRIQLMGKSINLGTYRTEKIANDVYIFGKKLIRENKLEKEIIESIKIKFPDSSLNFHSKNKFKGVYKVSKSNKYQSILCLNGNKYNLGVFNTPEEAHQAYLKAKNERT